MPKKKQISAKETKADVVIPSRFPAEPLEPEEEVVGAPVDPDADVETTAAANEEDHEFDADEIYGDQKDEW